jgi:hypothetical protein
MHPYIQDLCNLKFPAFSSVNETTVVLFLFNSVFEEQLQETAFLCLHILYFRI